MDVTLGVRPGDDGTVVAVSGEVDVCTEAPLQQALLRIMREHGARLLLDVSGVSFMDCAGLRVLLATSAAVRRIIELTGAHEALATQRSTTVALHLHQVFCKLDIRSRVDLARIALEHARPEAALTP
jgi:anti-anti-sigma factor